MLLIYYADKMNRSEFEHIRNLPGKKISRSIQFSGKKASKPLLILESVPVENADGLDLVLAGSYNPEINRLTLNFSVRGTGPICRFCVNGRLHPGAGRTHKHDLHEEEDPENNLPRAVSRDELSTLSMEEIWNTVCTQAKIEHDGTFVFPSKEASVD